MMKYIIGILLFTSILACNHKLTDIAELLKFINNSKNGLIKEKHFSDFKIVIKHLPASYMAIKESKGNTLMVDSLHRSYESSLAFLFSIIPDSTNDIMYRGISNDADYKARAQDINFNFSENIEIKTQLGKISPVLHSFENTYSLTNNRNIYLVFEKKQFNELVKSSAEFDLVFYDKYFGSGITHFVFDTDKIKQAALL